jgi:hypothetical protein
MPVPGSGPIQFMPANGAILNVLGVTDPNGVPADVLDVDQGFTVNGNVVLPNWLSGTGTVTIYADELGGPLDRALVPSTTIAIVSQPTEPNPVTYDWHITFPGNVLPDPSTGSQLYKLAAIFMYGGQANDTAGFVVMGHYLIN